MAALLAWTVELMEPWHDSSISKRGFEHLMSSVCCQREGHKPYPCMCFTSDSERSYVSSHEAWVSLHLPLGFSVMESSEHTAWISHVTSSHKRSERPEELMLQPTCAVKHPAWVKTEPGDQVCVVSFHQHGCVYQFEGEMILTCSNCAQNNRKNARSNTAELWQVPDLFCIDELCCHCHAQPSSTLPFQHSRAVTPATCSQGVRSGAGQLCSCTHQWDEGWCQHQARESSVECRVSSCFPLSATTWISWRKHPHCSSAANRYHAEDSQAARALHNAPDHQHGWDCPTHRKEGIWTWLW